jgi:hypothetical protein
MNLQQLAERAAGVLRRRGYTVIDNSASFDDISQRVEGGCWIVQFQNSPSETLTDTQLRKKANRK